MIQQYKNLLRENLNKELNMIDINHSKEWIRNNINIDCEIDPDYRKQIVINKTFNIYIKLKLKGEIIKTGTVKISVT